MRESLKNLLFFKLGWLACILLAAAGKPALAVLAVAAVVALHLFRVPVAAKEALLLTVAGLTGLAWESLMVFSGLIEYPGSAFEALAPLWIVSMWVLFATTLNHGFKWIKRHWAIAAAFGAVGGPLAFLSGSAMGAAQFSNMPLALAVIGAGWAVMLPALALAADTIIDSEWLEPAPGASRSMATEFSRPDTGISGGPGPALRPRGASLIAHFGVNSHHV